MVQGRSCLRFQRISPSSIILKKLIQPQRAQSHECPLYTREHHTPPWFVYIRRWDIWVIFSSPEKCYHIWDLTQTSRDNKYLCQGTRKTDHPQMTKITEAKYGTRINTYTAVWWKQKEGVWRTERMVLLERNVYKTTFSGDSHITKQVLTIIKSIFFISIVKWNII